MQQFLTNTGRLSHFTVNIGIFLKISNKDEYRAYDLSMEMLDRAI